jgi:putative SOS response-associated peptidase YedK
MNTHARPLQQGGLVFFHFIQTQMCYAYASNFDRENLKARYGLHDVPLSGYHFFNSAFTRPLLPVITDSSCLLLSWGLVPHWAKTPEQAAELAKRGFNARGETLPEKPMFRDAFRHGRCLVPATGFYEWRTEGTSKYPFFIYPKDADIFSLAAIAQINTDQDTGEIQGSFAIVTKAADSKMGWIHNSKRRMPLILQAEEERQWLEGSDTQAMEILLHNTAPAYSAHPVGKRASQARMNRDVAEVQQKADYPALTLPWA